MRSRVLIADDHLEMATAVTNLLQPCCEVVGTVADGFAALEAVARLKPDVLLLDLNMPGPNVFDLCRRIVRDYPATAVIVLTAEMDPAFAQLASAAGARAFVQKFSAAEDLPVAIARMHRGDPGV